MAFSRKVTYSEYKMAMNRVATTSLARWCIHMVRYGYLADVEIELNIINLAVNGE